MKERIRNKLEKSLTCSYLKVIDESYLHAGHNDFDGTEESHFKIVISTPELNNLSKVKSHQQIYEILKKEMSHIHALSIDIIRT